MTSSRLRFLLCCGALALGLTTASSGAVGIARAPEPRRSLPPRSHLTADLGAALGRLHRAVEGERPGLKAAGSLGDRGELLAAWDGVRAADLAFRDRFMAARARLVAAGAGAAVVARLDDAERTYARASDAILKPLAEPLAEARRAARDKGRVAAGTESQLAHGLPGVAAALDEAVRREAPVRILGANALPYRPLQLAARAPVSAPAIQPSYLNPLETASTPADLTATAEAPLDAEIVAKARELAFDPVKIYELVLNGVATEWYAGSMKGAVETLHQGSGNDVDQASLLIALLRASSLPARYVQGVIELPVEALSLSLGVPVAQVPAALARAGIANRPVVSGGRVAFVDLEHTWVAVQVPYTNYRGAVVDVSGRTWLALTPAIKTITETAPTGVLRRMGLDVGAAVTGYLAAPQPEEPLEAIRRQVLAYLHLQSADSAYAQELGSRAVRAETLGILPGSLAVKVVAVTAEQATLAPALQHRIRFVVRSGPAETDPAVLDATLPLSDVAGRRVTLSYLPATVDDQRAVDAFGGLDSVPVYLVRVRAQIKVDGQVRAQGTGSVPLGATGRFEMDLSGPFGTEAVGETVVIGAYQAVAVGAQRAARKPGQGEIDNDTEELAAAILSQEALGYTERWDAAERELGGLLAVSVLRPLPSLAVVTDEVVVESVLGLPVDLTWQGATLDAALRTAEPFARTGDAAAARDFLRLSALEGSALEHKIFEADFLVDSLSADKGLGLARKAGAEVVTVTAQNADAVVPALAHPQGVRDDIANWARLGMSIDVPRGPITLNAWRGAVWRVEDPRTGTSGYFLAGGLAGGATTEPVDGWVLEFLRDALAAPYSSKPDQDPLAAASISKILSTDGQTGEVGKELPYELAVMVHDAAGRPVKGASVVFTSIEGGGHLLDSRGQEQEQVTVLTDLLGVASASLKLGTHTADDPTFVSRLSGDEFLTQGLFQLVEAEVASQGGAVSVDSPFTAVALPGAPVRLRRTDTDQTEFTGLDVPGLFADLIHVAVEDSYGNPVANESVTVAVGDMTTEPSCSNPPPNPQNAAVFSARHRASCPAIPTLGQCGGPIFTDFTDASGLFAGVILGNSVVSGYRVNVSSGSLTPLSFFYSIQFMQDISNLECKATVEYRVDTGELVDPEGRNIQAARVGQAFGVPIRSTVFYWHQEAEIRRRDDGKYYFQHFPQGQWVSSSAELTYIVGNGGSASPAAFVPTGFATESLPAPGYYLTDLTVGPTPGLNTITGSVSKVRSVLHVLDQNTGVETLQDQLKPELPFTVRITDVWGVDPRITGVSPSPLVLTGHGQLSEPAVITYRIDPPQYQSASSGIDDFTDGELTRSTPGTSRSGLGSVMLPRGSEFLADKRHEAQLVLNRGTGAEVRSDLTDFSVFQTLFKSYKSQVSLTQDVDLVNQRVCAKPDIFQFSLNQAADVTLSMRQVNGLNKDGAQDLGAPVKLLDHVHLAEGDHNYSVSLGGVPADFTLVPGTYQYELEGVAASDGHQEKVGGTVESHYTTHDSLPVGHVLVKGVDLFDGNLTVSRDDFSLPGRGLPLEFRRFYASNNGNEPGPLGVGWDHNYNSRVVVNPCGDVIVMGGEGSGMRFVDDGHGGLRPLRGYHGTLVASAAEHSFDFYSKSGNQFHYGTFGNGTWHLSWIADPNGNRTTLEYETASDNEPRVAAVRDAAGRALRFHYQLGAFAFWKGQVVTSVEAPGGIVETFEYDAFGNLARVAREPQPTGRAPAAGAPPSRAERYEYGLATPNAAETRHVLVATHDELTGATTGDEIGFGAVGVQGNVQVKRTNVSKVTDPEGGQTRFEFDPSLGDPATATMTVKVTDPRDKVTAYTLNRYGSPLMVEDPEHHITTSGWSPNDVLITSRTDANGVRTDYTYDAGGNVLTESLPVTDAGGQQHTYTVQTTYWPPATFDPPYIKDRVQSHVDRNGAVTRFEYDAHGNLLSQKTDVHDAANGASTLTVAHTYLANGDHATATDARGNLTSFAYDGYGNVFQVTDALRNVTEADYDVRSQPVRQVDALGRETLIDYDALGRVIRRTLPKAAGESASPVETVVYDDVARTVTATDANGHVTVTTSDREGRPIQVANSASGVKVFQYDPAGNKTLESTFGDGATPRQDTTFDYTDASRLLRRTEPLGKTTEYEYDGVGNVLQETLRDAGSPGFLSRIAEHVYDGLNRGIRTTRTFEGGAVVVSMTYDGENKIQDEDPLGRITHYRYDELKRLIETAEPEWKPGKPKTTQIFYDGNGNVVEERHLNEPVDQIRHNEYDPLNRLRKKTDGTGASTVFEYDAVGNKTREIDPRLDATSFDYDARNRMARATVSLNRVTTPNRQVTTQYAYDAVGNKIQEIWPNGNVIQHSYDALNRQIGMTDRLGTLMAYAYDARGNRLRETDARGNDTVNHYDALNRLVQQDLPENRTVSVTWDVAGNKLSATDPRHNTTAYRYDRLNRLIETDDPAPGRTTSTATYDLAGNKKTETDRRGNTTTYDYDALNRLVKTTDPVSVGTSVTYTFDGLGNKLTETDRRGIVSENGYDAESRLIRVVRAGVQLRTTEYDGAGNKTADTDANQHTTTYEYDERNLLTAENRPLAAVTHYRLDDMGDRSSMQDPEGRTSTYEHDVRRRLITETNAAQEITRYEYDGNGNRTKQTRPSQKSWTFVYDKANRLTSVADPLSDTETYAYDGNGNRTAQTDANLHTTSLEYDERNRLTAKVEPGGARWELGYDGNGNQTSLKDALSQVITTQYDALNRETQRLYPAPAETGTDFLQSIVTVHDGNGNPKTLTEQYSGPTGTRVTTKTYDAFDRLESATDPKGEKLGYTYDANGNRTTLTDPDQKTTLYAYDDLNRLATVTVSSVGTTEYTYFRDSRLKRVKNPGGGQADHTYDQAGRLQLLENSQNNARVSSFAYTFDANGNRTQQVEINGGAAETTTYGFDDADRLLTVNYPDKKVTYTYDGVGNRLTETSKSLAGNAVLSSKTFTYDDRNRLASVTDASNASATTTFEFDANGNQTARVKGGVRTEFHFDVRDKLVEVRQAGNLLEAYGYDYRGFRIRKSGPAGIVRYVFDDDSVLVQTDDAGNTIAKYDYGSDRLLAMTHVTDGRQFYLFDGLGSVTNLLKPDGSLAARYQYDAWGNYRATAGTSFSIFGFTGHQRDAATGLYYFKARYYDPELGVFLTEDPAEGKENNPPSLHRYLYAYANPTVYVDPTGRISLLEGWQKRLENFAETVKKATVPGAGTVDRIWARALTSGLIKVVSKGVGAVNLSLNLLIVSNAAADPQLNREAKRELGELSQKGKQVAKQLIEDPKGTIESVALAPSRALKGAIDDFNNFSSYDEETQTDKLASVAEVGIETAATAGAAKVLGLAAEGVAATSESSEAASRPLVLDLFGGRTSQIQGAINVDIAAQEGVRASAIQLPFKTSAVGELVASNPYIPEGSGMMDYLPEAARVLKPGGELIINSTARNPFGTLPTTEVLNNLGLKVVADRGPLLDRFANSVFRLTNGNVLPAGSVKTTILVKIK